MKSVKEFYLEVEKNEGKEIADKFLELLKYYDGSKSVLYAYYDLYTLGTILQEAKGGKLK